MRMRPVVGRPVHPSNGSAGVGSPIVAICRYGDAPWSAASSASRTSTGSRARSAASAGCSPDEVARYLFRRVVSWGRSSNVFLANGARLYLDVGSHPEYATPECDSIYDLVVHDKAGERILEQLLASAEQRLREEGIRGVIYLFKNNTDSAGNSYGCHENYLTSRRDDFGPLRRGADPVLRHPPDLRRRRQGAADGPGRDVLHRPAGRAHLGGRLVGHHPQPADHQHPRRAPRRRRALPPPARHRGRLQHERVRHLPQGRGDRRSCCACSRTRPSSCGT